MLRQREIPHGGCTALPSWALVSPTFYQNQRDFTFLLTIFARKSRLSHSFVSETLRKSANTIFDYLAIRRLTTSPEKCAAAPFTRRHATKYWVFNLLLSVLFSKLQFILGVTLDRSFTWSSHIRYPKRELSVFVHVLKFASDTRRGFSIQSLLHIYNGILMTSFDAVFPYCAECLVQH